MALKQNRKYLKPGLKIAGTIACLAFVACNIQWRQSIDILRRANLWWLLSALIALNLSQVVSARRLQFFFDLLYIRITAFQNLLLYYRGMFFNLLLPGGIGGDGYKVFYIKKWFGQRPGPVIKALITDRLSGLVAIIGIILLLVNWLAVSFEWRLLSIGGLILIYPLFYLFLWLFFRKFLPIFGRVNILAICVQVLQVLSVICLLAALGNPNGIHIYVLLFLVSSIAFVIPISVGGLGLREVVFLYGSRFFMFDEELSVTVSLMFFMLNALSSLPGAFLSMEPKDKSSGTNVVATDH
ncbi:lysylphosphatidylglycerol synthase transmembrane domain-containing protein [Roseivirga sp. BDSF3-8]|uniref:lysylphosphatidylglycerol synthase transmembrane domain-containing protein n=1 Tax=Roseivirga sp. BDSF3-8 TaxID=3241598 RepID=UPI003531EDE6